MNHKNKIKIIMLTTIVFFTGTIFNSEALIQNIENQMPVLPLNDNEGHFLYTPWHSTTTYLINETGAVNHTWQSTYYPLYDSYMGDNGSIYLAINSGQGGFQKIAYDNTVLWEYHYTRDSSFATHDIVPLPNGDVIIIMQEIKSRTQAIQAGRDPDTVGSQFYPNMLIQVRQTGPTSGDIVWEWHIWDHLIQDFDPSKDNYGNVSEHPELADINFDQYWSPGWPYVNSVDYNPKFDQILISAHNFDEFWILDHSTTTEEASSHEGGIYGQGGDILYRWGNPQTYDRGDSSDKKLYFQHQCCWVKPGLPGEGNILVFSNGNTRPGGPISSVEEITPDVNPDTGEYYPPPPGEPYGPDDLTWQYMLPANLFSDGFGGAQRMLNSNTFICSGWTGTFIEVTPDHEIVWTYINPYPFLYDKVYRTQYIPPYEPEPLPDLDCSGNLHWTDIKPGATIFTEITVENIGDSDTFLSWEVQSFPEWGTWSFNPDSGINLEPGEMDTIIVKIIAPEENNEIFSGEVVLVNTENVNDICSIDVSLATPMVQVQSYQQIIMRFFESHPNLFPLLHRFLGL